jgi:GT2 family glycosyltransferase
MPDLSIVIVNYNTREALRRCLASIEAQRANLDTQVIVVDNVSKDGSANMIREHFPQTVLLEPGVNTWFTGGNNLGVQAATGDYTLILNPDTIIQPGMLATMVEYLRSNPKVGAITCQMKFPDGRRQSTCSKLPGYLDLLLGYTFLGVLLTPLREKRRADMWYSGWDRTTTRPVEVIPDSCLMSPTMLLKDIGVYDDRMKLYFTEDDLCKRILAKGYEIHFVAGAEVLHEEHASVSQVQRLASQIYFDDLLIFSRKWYGLLLTLFLQALIIPTRWAMDTAQRLRGEKKG